MNAVRIENLTFAYPAREGETPKNVLDGLSLTVERGKFVSLIGSNGSGKSTLSRLIDGLLQPTSGTVEVFGESVSDKSRLFEIRKRVGTVFQNPDNQQVASIVEDDVAFGPENIGMPREKTKERIDFVLKATDMEKYRDTEVSRLSGGQKQRIAIAGMLAIEPQVLVLDEATAMLDPLGRKDILRIVKDLNRKKGITVIMITQYMEEAVIADRVIVMNEGLVAFEGTPAEVFRRGTELRKINLDVPPMVELRDDLAASGIIKPCNAMTVEEMANELCPLLLKI